MARFGTWAPLAANWASQPRMAQVDIISLHTMVGSLPVVDAMFRRNGFGGTFSHFGIGGDGACTQWQDTAYRAAANYNGNWHIVSVECADVGPPFPAWNTNDGNAVPAFSDAQIATLANLIRTIAPAHNIPIVLIPDAKPGRRGIGYHRQGVPGYMVAGAEQWSTAQGKVCPGNRRIAQIPQVIALAQGADMPLSQDDLNKISVVVKEWSAKSLASTPLIDWGGGKTATLPQQVADTMKAVATVQGQLAGVLEALKGISGGGVDLAAVKDAAEAGAQEALSRVQLTVAADDDPA